MIEAMEALADPRFGVLARPTAPAAGDGRGETAPPAAARDGIAGA
jgi:hypothetical protein